MAPEGSVNRAELISAAEERELAARLAKLAFEPFLLRGYEGRRRVVSFGLKYDFNGPGLVAAEPIPDGLISTRDRAAAFAGAPAPTFVQLLINEYREGAPIGWHRDRPVFDKIVGVSLLAPAVLRFRRRVGKRFGWISTPLAPRSAYLLHGAARTAWEHSLPEAKARRYSLTFRNLHI